MSDAPATAPASSTKAPSNTEAPKPLAQRQSTQKAAPAPVKTEKAPRLEAE